MIVITQFEVNVTTNRQVFMCYMNMSFDIMVKPIVFFYILFVNNDNNWIWICVELCCVVHKGDSL
jgi:hypothetical protein